MDDKRNGSADYRDERSGAYDPVNEAGKPQPNQVPETITPQQAMQNGGDVRPQPVVQPAIVLPEGLRRPPRGPVNRKARSWQLKLRAATRTHKRPAHSAEHASHRVKVSELVDDSPAPRVQQHVVTAFAVAGAFKNFCGDKCPSRGRFGRNVAADLLKDILHGRNGFSVELAHRNSLTDAAA